ncbi:MAG: BamA/TamA family outer membrane protein [Bacteroidota bacterium]
MRPILLICCFLAFPAVAQKTNVFLIGDSGVPPGTERSLDHLTDRMAHATKEDVLVLMGNTLLPRGLPPAEDLTRAEHEARLSGQLEVVKQFPGKKLIIPGNAEWADGHKEGWMRVNRMERFVTEYLGEEVFQPKGGCPGPVEIELTDEVVLLIIDTQYLLHPWDKPRQKDGCEAGGSLATMQLISDVILRNKHKHLLVVGHHPIYTHGPRGSGLGLSPQHARSPKYRVIRKALLQAFAGAEDLVYASAHDQSLQYIEKDGNHFIVSGAGAAATRVRSGSGTKFAEATPGFAQLTYEKDGPTRLKFWKSESNGLLYDQEIFSRQVMSRQEAFAVRPDFTDSLVSLAGNESLALKGKSQKFWMGNSYRTEWSAPIPVPVIDIEKEYGGLVMLKKGGGGQTRSLRLEADNGRQYVLRSIKKWPDAVVPLTFRQTFAVELVYDQISASHPYGAIVVPPLAEAAGIYHTNPKLVFLPSDPNFGVYQNQFAGLMALYEERPNDEAAFEEHFGAGEEIEGTPKVIEDLQKDNDNSIDARFMLRNRMFDMMIGDWDRHEDQWRWAEYTKPEGGKLYKPIPRDRDQAFFTTQGFIPYVIASKWGFPMFQGMTEDMRWTPGFNWQSRWLDRSFLNSLEWSDWKQQINEVQAGVTDEVIDDALKLWPQVIYDESAPRVSKVLKARRSNLEDFGREHYEFLAKEVDVLGSDKHEYFLVERLDDDRTKVTVRKRRLNGDLEQVIYERTFLNDETKEIVLYGFDGEDIFDLKGEAKRGPKVRIVSGKDRDVINDESRVSGLSKKTVVYDKPKTELNKSKETKDKRSDDPEIHLYNRKAYEYDKVFPLVDIRFNPDDGLFLGGGFLWDDKGFRKDPYKQKHQLTGSYAVATGAFGVKYKGSYIDLLGKWDMNMALDIVQPFGVANFFGLGNESEFDFEGEGDAADVDNPIDFYRIRYELWDAKWDFSYDFWRFSTLTFGTRFNRFEVRETSGRFITDPDNGLDPDRIFDEFYFGGVFARYELDTRDDSALPTKGINFFVQFDNNYGLNERAEHYSRLNAGLTHYFQFRVPSKVVIANRVEFDQVYGETEFFNSVLIGQEKIRGYRRTRFIGDTGFYHNIDLRLRLFSFTSYLFPGTLGVLGFHDIGRVWLEGEESNSWHRSAGAGIWLAPVNLVAINFTVAFSEEETLPLVSLSYHF